MKFSFAYVKSNPVLFGGIIVLGILFWFLLNHKSAAADGSTTLVNSGPSDAQIAAATSLELAQIQAGSQVQLGQLQLAALATQGNNDLQLANIEAEYRALELASTERQNNSAITASVAALKLQLDNNLSVTDSNNQFMVDYATVAADSAVTQLQIGAMLQRDLSAQQLEAYKYSSTLGAIGTLKKKDRDNALAGFAGYAIPNDPKRSGGGGGFLKAIAGIVAPPVNLI